MVACPENQGCVPVTFYWRTVHVVRRANEAIMTCYYYRSTRKQKGPLTRTCSVRGPFSSGCLFPSKTLSYLMRRQDEEK